MCGKQTVKMLSEHHLRYATLKNPYIYMEVPVVVGTAKTCKLKEISEASVLLPLPLAVSVPLQR